MTEEYKTLNQWTSNNDPNNYDFKINLYETSVSNKNNSKLVEATKKPRLIQKALIEPQNVTVKLPLKKKVKTDTISKNQSAVDLYE